MANYKKLKRNYRKKSKISFPLTGPVRLYRKVRFGMSASSAIASINGDWNAIVYRANSIFDPDFSGLGSQPRSIDQYFTLYQHSVVLYAKIVVRLAYRSSTETDSVRCLLNLSGSSAPLADDADLMESRYRKFGMLTQGGKTQMTMSMKVDPNKFLSISSPIGSALVRGDDTTSSNLNPTEQCFFHISIKGVVDSSVTVDVQGYIDYDVCFTEPRLPVQS